MKKALYSLSFLLLIFVLVACTTPGTNKSSESKESTENTQQNKESKENASNQQESQTAPIVLRFAHNQTSLENPYHKGLTNFAQNLEKISDGKMKAEVFPGTLGTNEADLALKLNTDSCDVIIAMPGFMSSTGVKEFDVLSLLYLFDSFEDWESKIDGEFGETMKKLVSEKTDNEYKIIGYYSSGVRNFYGKRPIVEPQDAKGLNIRTQGSKVQHEFWISCGANPISVGWQELYQALNTGTADAAENDFTSMSLKEHHKTPNGKYTSLTNHDFTTALILVNGKRFDQFTEEQQMWILEACNQSVRYQRDVVYEMAKESKDRILKDGGEINEVNLEAFKRIGREIQDKFAKENNMQELLELVRKK